MAQIQLFEEPGIGASVLLAESKEAEGYLEIGEHGVLDIPSEVKPNGFHLVLYVLREARVVIAQKNVSQDKGDYHSHALAQLGDAEDFKTWVMHDAIKVKRVGKDVWTNWHSVKPNRIDCWQVEKDGRLVLTQIGVITTDNGKTFRLLGEPRWQGMILKTPAGELVAKPDESRWGPLLWNEGESRYGIREHPKFKEWLADAELGSWGRPRE